MFWKKWIELRRIKKEYDGLIKRQPPADQAARRRMLAESLGALQPLLERARELGAKGEALAQQIEKKADEQRAELNRMAAQLHNSLLQTYYERSKYQSKSGDAAMLPGR